MKYILFLIVLLAVFFCPSKIMGQTASMSSKELIKIESIIKTSSLKLQEAEKKVFRAEQKLAHLKTSGNLSFDEFSVKEGILNQAKEKLKEMKLLVNHNHVLVKQTKSNPSFGKSVPSSTQKAAGKSQKKSFGDKQREKLAKIRAQQKESLVNRVKEQRTNLNKGKSSKGSKED